MAAFADPQRSEAKAPAKPASGRDLADPITRQVPEIGAVQHFGHSAAGHEGGQGGQGASTSAFIRPGGVPLPGAGGAPNRIRRSTTAPNPGAASDAQPSTRIRARSDAAPVIRRYVQFGTQKNVLPDTKIASFEQLAELTGLKLNPKTDVEWSVVERFLKSPQPFLFSDVEAMMRSATAKSASHPFVMKAEEASPDASHGERSESKTSRYDFRNNPKAELPDIGPDPTQKQKKSKEEEAPGYYYHITSYTNLKGVFANGLNPAAGGNVGGSSFQNAKEEMNKSSADDSKNKVFVATVGKLTQRYLSFRLRQNDLFTKHSECIVSVLAEHTKLNDRGARQIFAQISMGEEPVVLRFANHWAPKDWVPDPIDKAAYALQGKPVAPAHIECLTLDGWAPLTVLTEIVQLIPDGKAFEVIRGVLLSFYGKFNEKLESMKAEEGWAFIEKPLVEELLAHKVAAK